ncbi:GNAT family N-acetyltransferase [Labrys wisconsinensis]|uniref:N-acetyltransferase YhbS n=1 Tax=Labrys wisconsinensis TaxID=425677 RepID=A0ABU0JL13_9HYPH|nr:GNAT family N-acetyltransferase [Labrys wisconsinensis]MDQ0474980.1 putative N-acetyltransferase YhbS [Labrys wisconsinensis]
MIHRSPMLRPLRQGEAEAMRRIETAARGRYGSLAGFEGVVAAPAIAAERFLVGETLVAEAGGSAVGYVLMQPLDGLLYVANIAVLPEASGLGLGAALIEAARGRSRALRLGGLMLTTFRTPPWNGPWFRRLGFSPMPPERIGPGLAAILDRHASFLDMSRRETLWSPARPGQGAGSAR